MTTANENPIAEALDGVLAGEAAAQTAEQPETPEAKTDIVAEAVKAATAKPSPSDEQVSADEKTKGKDPVPYDRFSEVIEQKNKAIERLNTLESQYRSASEREDSLRSRVSELENEHQILEAIRDLGRDTRYQDAVARIDRALQGIEDEVEEAKEVGDNKAQAAAESKFAKKTEELEELVSEQRAEALWSKSQDYATALLDSLPEEYTDVDKTRISKMWTPRVDWNAIETQGAEVIPQTLKTSLAALIKEYGTPQGALEQRVRTEVTKEIPEEARVRAPEDVVKSVVSKDFAETKDGKPVISDADFADDIATVLRATRQA